MNLIFLPLIAIVVGLVAGFISHKTLNNILGIGGQYERWSSRRFHRLLGFVAAQVIVE